MQLIGDVRDIQPKRVRPQMELHFPRTERRHFPDGKKEPVTILFGWWRLAGTMRTDTANPPYFHHALSTDGGATDMTKLFLGLGVADGARVAFERVDQRTLRFLDVVEPGKWHPGRVARRR